MYRIFLEIKNSVFFEFFFMFIIKFSFFGLLVQPFEINVFYDLRLLVNEAFIIVLNFNFSHFFNFLLFF